MTEDSFSVELNLEKEASSLLKCVSALVSSNITERLRGFRESLLSTRGSSEILLFLSFEYCNLCSSIKSRLNSFSFWRAVLFERIRPWQIVRLPKKFLSF